MRIYAVFGDNAVMIEYAHYTKAFGSIAEATAEATDHLWEIAPLNRAIPEFLKPGKIYFANKLPLNTQGE